MVIFDEALNIDAWLDSNALGRYFLKDPRKIYESPYKNKYDFLINIKYVGVIQLPDEEVHIVYIKIKDTKIRTKLKIVNLAYDIIKTEMGRGNALFFIEYENSNVYRLSYVKIDHDGKSDPKRFTYVLGQGIPTHTPKSRLTPQAFESIKSLEDTFSIEPINKEFYSHIQDFFYKIVDDKNIKAVAKNNIKNFALRFLGRILFCWFLKEKELIPKCLLHSDAIEQGHYKNILEHLFFDVLNVAYGQRSVLKEYESKIPYLNGGLFKAQDDDYKGIIEISDSIIKDIFEKFEQYNFTVDEATPVDVEISIDPEMLGRIFENLLAEIDENTGQSARKSSGSYYTPREIVDYMVSESLKLYLKNKINIDEQSLSNLFSTTEDVSTTDEQRKQILQAIHSLKILDPACGSGAFPMGILSRVFTIINRLDPEHKYYRDLTLGKIKGVARTQYEKLYNAQKFDYAYKLDILKDMIYGVDVQTLAIEISRLRAFLSLVVEERKDESDDNLGILPLPNLEFNFIAANSLVGLDDKGFDNFWDGMFSSFITEMKDIRKKYFYACSNDEKKTHIGHFEALLTRIKMSELEKENKK